VGEIFKEFFDKAPDIIGKAAQSPLGLVALSVLVLGAVGFLLFRNAAGKLKLGAFAMITGGFLAFMALVFIFAGNPNPEEGIAEIAAAPPKLRNDGGYSLPILIKSVGKSPILNFQVIVGNAAKPNILTMSEEDDLFYNNNSDKIVDIVSKFKITEDGVSRVLRKNSEYIEYGPLVIANENQMDDVKSGRMYLYYFMIIAYQESPNGKFYFGQYCARFEPQTSAFARCWHENFSKRTHL